MRNTGTPTWNVLKISGVSHVRVEPFGGENTFCFSLELRDHPGIASLLENSGGENLTAARSRNAHEVMGQVWGSSYLTLISLPWNNEFAHGSLLVTSKSKGRPDFKPRYAKLSPQVKSIKVLTAIHNHQKFRTLNSI